MSTVPHLETKTCPFPDCHGRTLSCRWRTSGRKIHRDLSDVHLAPLRNMWLDQLKEGESITFGRRKHRSFHLEAANTGLNLQRPADTDGNEERFSTDLNGSMTTTPMCVATLTQQTACSDEPSMSLSHLPTLPSYILYGSPGGAVHRRPGQTSSVMQSHTMFQHPSSTHPTIITHTSLARPASIHPSLRHPSAVITIIITVGDFSLSDFLLPKEEIGRPDRSGQRGHIPFPSRVVPAGNLATLSTD